MLESVKSRLQHHLAVDRKAVLIVNTQSRRGQRLFFAALDELANQKIELVASHAIRRPERLRSAVQESISQGNRLIIIGGGDGTISSVCNSFANQEVALGLLPLGTSNSFVRTLGIPLKLGDAVDVIATGKVADVDLGKAGNNYFSNVTTIGISVEIARRTPHLLKRFLGPIAYAGTGLYCLALHRPFDCTFTVDGDSCPPIKTHQIIVANGSYYGINRLAPELHADSRRLVVFPMANWSRRRLMQAWLEFTCGKSSPFADSGWFSARQVEIETKSRQFLNVDGEITTQTPVSVLLAEEALNVIVPQGFRDV